MRGIEIHYEQPDGARGVINYFTGDNAEVFASSAAERDAKRKRLIAHARHMAGQWSSVFPNDKFSVVNMDKQ
jgi:hypothetical protein